MFDFSPQCQPEKSEIFRADGAFALSNIKITKKVSASSHFLLFPCLALLIANSHYIPLIRGMKAGNAKNSVASVCVSNYNKLGAVFILLMKGKPCRRKRMVAFLLL